MVQILKLKLERDTDCPSVKDDLQVCTVKYTVYLKYQPPPCVLHFTLKKKLFRRHLYLHIHDFFNLLMPLRTKKYYYLPGHFWPGCGPDWIRIRP